jgi:hypothetical protein
MRGLQNKTSPGSMRVNDVIGIYMTYEQHKVADMVVTTPKPVFQLYDKIGNPLVRLGRDGDIKPLDTIVFTDRHSAVAANPAPLIQWIKPYEDPKTCQLVERIYDLEGVADASRVARTRASVASNDKSRLVSLMTERMLEIPRFRHLLLPFTNPHAPKMVAVRKYAAYFLEHYGTWFADSIGFKMPCVELDMQPQELWEHALLVRRLWERNSSKFNFQNFLNAMILALPHQQDELPLDFLQFISDYVGDHGCPVCTHGCMVDSCKLREIELFTLKDSVAEALVSVRVKRLVLLAVRWHSTSSRP